MLDFIYMSPSYIVVCSGASIPLLQQPLGLQRLLDLRALADALEVRLDVGPWRELDVEPRRPVENGEEVRVGGRVLVAHQVLLARERCVEGRQAAADGGEMD